MFGHPLGYWLLGLGLPFGTIALTLAAIFVADWRTP